MTNATSKRTLPALPLEAWEGTKQTLHLFIQIVGKIRLGTFPNTNHWWHAPLYLSVRGLTTRPIPYRGMMFEIEFDFLHHVLSIRTTGGKNELLDLSRASVAQFYRRVCCVMAALEIDVKINAVPYGNISNLPFELDNEHASYDKLYVNRFWRILVQVGSIFERFRANFSGKSSPVHLFWRDLDLVVTRYSGRRAPKQIWTSQVEREAHSHEFMTFGFWPGSERTHAPAFYAYAYPEPPGLAEAVLKPSGAYWQRTADNCVGLLPYDLMRASADPGAAALEFLDSAYAAGANAAAWDSTGMPVRSDSDSVER